MQALGNAEHGGRHGERLAAKIKENYKPIKHTTMKKYNYYESVKECVKDYISEQGVTITADNREELRESLYDGMWVSDSVTGNCSGSYTFSRYKAEENICHNLDLLEEACEEFGGNYDVLKDGAEACDVTIRCYILGQVLDEVLDELEDNE